MFGGKSESGPNGKHLREEVLSEYLDGTLSPRETAAVQQHIAECSACSHNLETLRQTVLLLRDLPQVAVPRAFTLTEADVYPQRSQHNRVFSFLRAATAAVAILLAVVVGGDVALRGGFLTQRPLSSVPESAATERVLGATQHYGVQEEDEATAVAAVPMIKSPQETEVGESAQPAMAPAAATRASAEADTEPATAETEAMGILQEDMTTGEGVAQEKEAALELTSEPVVERVVIATEEPAASEPIIVTPGSLSAPLPEPTAEGLGAVAPSGEASPAGEAVASEPPMESLPDGEQMMTTRAFSQAPDMAAESIAGSTDADHTATPTMSPEEIARATAAPSGMGSGGMTPSSVDTLPVSPADEPEPSASMEPPSLVQAAPKASASVSPEALMAAEDTPEEESTPAEDVPVQPPADAWVDATPTPEAMGTPVAMQAAPEAESSPAGDVLAQAATREEVEATPSPEPEVVAMSVPTAEPAPTRPPARNVDTQAQPGVLNQFGLSGGLATSSLFLVVEGVLLLIGLALAGATWVSRPRRR